MALGYYKSVFKTLGMLMMVFSFSMVIPFIVSAVETDVLTASSFVASFFFTLIMGLLLWVPSRSDSSDIRLHEGFLIVALFWIILALFGSIPFFMLPDSNISLTDAVFESTSGLTTTGATILTGLDDLPKGLLFYRSQLQWLGGLGIIVLAVAIMPLLGVGGMQLYRAESGTGIQDSKFTPRQTETAKSLARIYLALTFLCMLGYLSAGMSFFDAICHAMTTTAIGGFSTHDASFAFFEGMPGVYLISSLFMFLAGINFTLHFFAWKSKSLLGFLKDSEFKAYLLLLILVTCIASLSFVFNDFSETNQPGLSQIIFQVISIGTTTGYTSSGYFLWPAFIPFLLIVYSFIGGCVGSTGGGLKVGRCLMMLKQVFKELKQLIHPSAEIPVKMNAKSVDEKVLNSVWGFVSAYLIILVVFSMILMWSGLDQVSSFSAIAASLNNLGPGLGDVSSNYASLSDFNKWVCVLAMVLGRLEIFALLVLLTPTFWRD